jgi:DNA-binding protein YbaB
VAAWSKPHRRQRRSQGVKIDPQVVKDGDIEMLEDLIVAAIAQAQESAAKLNQDTMSELTGGMNIPGLGM